MLRRVEEEKGFIKIPPLCTNPRPSRPAHRVRRILVVLPALPPHAIVKSTAGDNKSSWLSLTAGEDEEVGKPCRVGGPGKLAQVPVEADASVVDEGLALFRGAGGPRSAPTSRSGWARGARAKGQTGARVLGWELRQAHARILFAPHIL